MKQISKGNVTYTQYPDGTLMSGPLDQSGKIGGEAEEERNQVHNPQRLQRILQFHPRPHVLDYGCGSGMLVHYLRSNGVEAWGYDKYAKDIHKEPPGLQAMARVPLSEYVRYNTDIVFDAIGFPENRFDVITMIEVIEHTSEPFNELDLIFRMLKPGGVVMIETSFTDWMDIETDPYINPSLGHSTIFSHKGLDMVMAAKGFEAYGHINRNVRVYQKPEPPFEPKITLVTMGQANPVALKRTLDSFKGVVDEIVFGDLLIFETDRALIEAYQEQYNMKIVKLAFNYIFEHGFAYTLNTLADFATHDWVLYMNVSEVIDGEHPIKEQMSKAYNCYSFDHKVDPHRWFRLYNRKELKWGGLIHEELIGDLRPCPFHVFRMMDTEKDMEDPFKAKVSNDVKELTYFNQYIRLVNRPELRGNTNQHWIDYATRDFDSLIERLEKKGKRYQAFEEGNLTMYLEDVYTNPEFEQERFKSSELINFQGDRKLL